MRRRRVIRTAAIRVRAARVGLGHGRDNFDLVIQRTRRIRSRQSRVVVGHRFHVIIVRWRGGI